MNVMWKNHPYHIKFMHKLSDEKNRKKRRFLTYCFIYMDKKEKPFSTGISKLNPIDELNRNMGKLHALLNALLKARAKRDVRIIFFNEFHKNFKI